MLMKSTSSFAVFFATLLSANFESSLTAAASISSVSLKNDYPLLPNEVLSIRPVLLYPKRQEFLNIQGRRMEAHQNLKDNDIIYVKLRQKNYRPMTRLPSDEYERSSNLEEKDIFYVKSLANGQFSHHRLQWFRLPEFLAISVFHKGKMYR